MRTIQSIAPHALAVVAISALSMALSGCNRHADDPVPAPATVVMPGSAAPDAATTAASGTPQLSNSAVPTGATSGSTGVPPEAPSTGLTGGTVTVLPGTAAPATSASAGLPASATELPTPGVIGPASAPASDQPPSVAPGTTR